MKSITALFLVFLLMFCFSTVQSAETVLTEKSPYTSAAVSSPNTTEAIWDLSKNISLEAQIPDELTEKPLWLKYPAQEALVKCGNRSIRYMLENIESSDNELIQKLSIEVIWQVMGEGLTQVLDGKNYARMIIEKRIDEETDSVKKARLQSSLKYLGRTEGIN